MTTTPEDLAAFPNRYAVEREIEAAENPVTGALHLNDGHERVRLPGGTLRRMLAVIDQLAAMASGAQHGEPVDRSAVIGLFDCWAYETLPGTPVDCDKVNALSAQIVRALTRPTAPAEPAEACRLTDDQICDLAEKHGLGKSMNPIGLQTGKVFATPGGCYRTEELIDFAHAVAALQANDTTEGA